jgi:mannose-6-phosphate isomerase-like protein (cupin superfamily)
MIGAVLECHAWAIGGINRPAYLKGSGWNLGPARPGTYEQEGRGGNAENPARGNLSFHAGILAQVTLREDEVRWRSGVMERWGGAQNFFSFRRAGVRSGGMKSKVFFGLLAGGLLLTILAAEKSDKTPVIQIDHETVAAAFAKGGPLLATNNFKVQAGRRTGPGEVEIHERDTDIFYIMEGSGTFVTGGKPVETKIVSPGETRGKELIGGEERHLVKGDIIVIPTGVPHWFKEVNGPLLYYVVKVSR